MDGAAAAVISDLGLGERIVGTAAPDLFAALPAEKKALLERIPVLDPGQGNAEKVIAAGPDLVVGVSVYSFGGFDGTPSVDRLAQAGAAVVVACDSEARGTVKDLSATVRFVTGLAGVLGVEEAGRRLVREIQSSVDSVRADGRPPVRVLAISGPPAAGQTVMTQGGTSLANGVITLAGGANVAEDALTDFVSLSAEEIVARDPEAIVVVSGFSREGEAELAAAIRASAVLSRTTAVRENRIVVVPQSILLSPSTANGLAVRRIAEALRRPAS
ncbi:ABC transporter substrate-binding protein [Lentzea sp. HUAS12]|uniref:ABC transporter substrate-binding protein n=1 Tax=Lentzea sp. HUAS12 TaxID=2951806 RepID=UPI00209F8310|nr:ABC transporter substrate-binding protein [Lentzea sp. HUAS12]USX54022.1 ABC transporter substrate-binding protein [Lentzea sp. HUAS12]